MARRGPGRPRKNTITFDNDTGEVMEGEESEQHELPREPPQVYVTEDDNDLRSAPIQNTEFLPLFPDADSFPETTVAHIKVTKLAPIGEDGYKGQLPATSSEEAIWRLWRDGTYRVEACNAQGQVLRRRDNVVISKGEVPGAPAPAAAGGADMAIVMKVLETVKDQIRTLKEDKEVAISQVRRQQEDHVKVLEKTTGAAQQNMADFYKSSGASQQSFFAAMMQMTAQSHQMVMQQMMAMQQMSAQQNDPRAMIAVLMQGMQLMRELGGEEEEDPKVQMFKLAGQAIGDIKDLAVGTVFKPKKLAAPKMPAVGIPGIPEAPKLAASATPSQPSPDGNGHSNPAKERTFSKTEAFKMRELKKLADQKGLDFDDLLDQALGFVSQAPDADTPEAVEENDTAQAEGSSDGSAVHGEESQDASPTA